MKIPFGEFAPDAADYNQDVATVADNCIAGAGKYEPLLNLGSTVHSITQGSLTGYLFTAVHTPNDYIFPSKVVAKSGPNVWVSGTAVSGLFTYTGNAGINAGYPFTWWDDDLIFGGGGTEIGILSTAQLSSGTPTATRVLGSIFPTTIGKVRDFLVIGGYYNGSATYQDTVRWSGFNDPTYWTIGSNQSDEQALINGGPICRIMGGDQGTVFQQSKITRMTYIGEPAIFQFDVLEGAEGTDAGKSVVQVGSDYYYLANSGFKILKDGISTIPIGDNKVDKWFFSQLGGRTNYLESIRSVVGAFDSISKCVYWSFPSYSVSTTDTNDRVIIFNTRTGKWSTATLSLSTIFSIPEEIGTAPSDHVEPHALGAIVYNGTTGDFKKLDGSTLAATVETGEFSFGEKRTQLNEIRPLIDGTATVTTETRNILTESVTSTGPTSVDSTGKANVRTNARYTRIKCITSGAFTGAVGVEAEPKQGSKR